MKKPLANVEGSQIDGFVTDMYKIMSKSAKTFQELPGTKENTFSFLPMR